MVAYQDKLTPDKLRLLVIGFQGLREGSLYMIVGTLLIVIGFAAFLASAGFSLYVSNITGFMAGAIASLIIILIAVILSFLGLVKWRHGGAYFRQFDSLRYSYAETGPQLMLWSIYLLIISILMLILGFGIESPGILMVGVGLLVIAAIILLIGEILFGIFLLRIKELQTLYGISVPDFTIDAVLWFLGIILELLLRQGAVIGSIITLISIILIYMHSGEAISIIRMTEANLVAEAGAGENKPI